MQDQPAEVSQVQGVGGTLKNILIRPAAAFQTLDVKQAVTLAVVLMVLACFFSTVAAMTVPVDEFFPPEIPPEQAEIAENIMEMMRSPGGIAISVVIGAIGTAVGALIKAGLLTLFFMMLGAKASYVKTLAVLALAWIPLFFREALRSISTLAAGTPFLEAASPLANHLDIFVLWNAILLVIGFAIIYKISYAKSAIPVAVYWLLTVLFSLGMGSISGMFTP